MVAASRPPLKLWLVVARDLDTTYVVSAPTHQIAGEIIAAVTAPTCEELSKGQLIHVYPLDAESPGPMWEIQHDALWPRRIYPPPPGYSSLSPGGKPQ